MVLRFTTARGNIATIDVIADSGRLRELDLALLDDRRVNRHCSQSWRRIGATSRHRLCRRFGDRGGIANARVKGILLDLLIAQ